MRESCSPLAAMAQAEAVKGLAPTPSVPMYIGIPESSSLRPSFSSEVASTALLSNCPVPCRQAHALARAAGRRNAGAVQPTAAGLRKPRMVSKSLALLTGLLT